MIHSSRRIIGVDESGKGDFFGSLVIASFLADDKSIPELKALGVRDGKLISEKKILEIDKKLRDGFPYQVIVFTPEKYNRLYEKIKNLNILLAEGHALAIDQLIKKAPADLAISDKFGKTELIEKALLAKGQKVPIKQLVRGESIIQVAAASIIARARFIRELKALSEKYEFELPRGAAPKVDEAGRKFVRKHGVSFLSKVAKMHFKNYRRVVNPVLFT